MKLLSLHSATFRTFHSNLISHSVQLLPSAETNNYCEYISVIDTTLFGSFQSRRLFEGPSEPGAALASAPT